MADIDYDTGTGGIATVECPYKDRCTDAGVKCATCFHNPKRSYYRPIGADPYQPYSPYLYSSYPRSPDITWITTTATGST